MTASIDELLNAQRLPGTNVSLSSVLREDARVEGSTLKLVLGVPVARIRAQLAESLREALGAAGAGISDIDLSSDIPGAQVANQAAAVPGVKNIVAVASGKGGVGKSTTAVNLALALVQEGARVGILDADIYGPSQSQMLGVADQRPQVVNKNMLLPLQAHGVSMISMGNLATEDTPMIWRGPMVSGALQQLLSQTQWRDIDYLIVDMPPGTGDIALTLAQRVPVTGSVIVTTPQDIALLDAKKGIEMFRKVNIPVFGVVENMAVHICSKCGHREHIFGEDGGLRLAEQYGVEVLGQLPLAMNIREQSDGGTPPVAAEPESAVAEIYRGIARRVALAVCRQAQRQLAPQIVVE